MIPCGKFYLLLSWSFLFPNFIFYCPYFRYQIMDAIEGPLRRRMQEELDKVDTEKLIHEKIPMIEEQARWMQGLVPAEETILEESTLSPHSQDDQVSFSESEEERGPS